MERLGQVGPAATTFRPDATDPGLDLVARMGTEHERAYLAELRTRYPGLVEIAQGDDANRLTLEAMRAGAPVISQGHLTLGDWHGYPDFLFRVDGPSALGDFHYIPWDTKLARSAKPYFIVQLCAYCEMLDAIQLVMPREFRFVLGHGGELGFRSDDFMQYYRRFKHSFLDFQARWNAEVIPDPGRDRSFGRWNELAEEMLLASDHLSRVANISRNQIEKLEAQGLDTFSALATTARNDCPPIKAVSFDILKRQARLQASATETAPPPWEQRPTTDDNERCGLALLPPASPEDIFFDLEGFPFAKDGLEYLWGAVTGDATAPQFHDWWAHDSHDEKVAFEQFIDWVFPRWQRDRSMHIYHYAAYEKSVLRRLASRYGTREYQVDELLRHEVMVDLYTVVRQGLLVGVHSYSLKYIEKLFLPAREGDVVSAAGSVVEYQRWLDSGEPARWQDSPLLTAIRDYNRVDCESTLLLRDWLLNRQREAGIRYISARPPAEGPVPTRDPSDTDLLVQKLAAIARQESDPERQRVAELLSQLVEFHRREEKPMWWRYFERQAMATDELYADADCLASLQRTSRAPVKVLRSLAIEYRFDPDQETTIHAGSTCVDRAPLVERPAPVDVLSIDVEAGTIELKQGPTRTLPDHLDLIPKDQMSAAEIARAVARYAKAYSDDASTARAVDDLLFRHPPRILGHNGGALITDGADVGQSAIDVVTRMDRTTLCIQGPPGTGKTHTAARIITELMRQGKRVGIATNSHKVIMNLLCAVERAMKEAGVRGALWKKGVDHDDAPAGSAIQFTNDNREAVAAAAAPGTVIGGTAWLFSREDMTGVLDYLFVDEAGQVSLANAVAMGQSAANLVLIGDQMQLSQPTQGSHPGESGASCLVYLMQEHATIPADLGIFLGLSYRMHPDVCSWISKSFYDRRLQSDVSTHANRVIAPPHSQIRVSSGVVYVPVETEGCEQRSDEEADIIETLVSELLQGQVSIKGEALRPVTRADILIVAPFNQQVRLLRERLGEGIAIGSVDKFQGKEAAVVIVSMCASTVEEAPRGAEFLLSPNRLNVAVSRAQALALVVGSTRLADARCTSIREMQLVNGWCGVVQSCHPERSEGSVG
ncbi:MAG TPA: TM0106 family RecB-like putative nuclease [Gemmatimonadales bacterium]|jgi:uncharacterized protein